MYFLEISWLVIVDVFRTSDDELGYFLPISRIFKRIHGRTTNEKSKVDQTINENSKDGTSVLNEIPKMDNNKWEKIQR